MITSRRREQSKVRQTAMDEVFSQHTLMDGLCNTRSAIHYDVIQMDKVFSQHRSLDSFL